ncbi:glycoside hydrolase family 5 protein [Mycena rebaudengoi]|nr:glycoside hydrolase family 5 protein [Mycena rebaudengoi]
MKFFLLATALLPTVLGANSFAGSNNYYAFALPQADRLVLLDGMKAAGMKVLLKRCTVTGVGAGQKASSNFAVRDLEANGLRNYDDTVLNLIDQLMVDAHARGEQDKVIHYLTENALQGGDIYGRTYGTTGFYTNPAAIDDFNQRITHCMNIHKNALLGNRPWSELSAYIFGLEPQNDHLSWICNAAQQIRNNVGDRKQLIFTGGGSAGASVQAFFFGSSCTAIDVVAIHDYTDGYDSYMPSAINQAKAAGKKLMVQEWGSLVGGGRTANMNSNVQKINSYKVPWLYWELITNPDPHQGEDYEIQINGADWSTISSAALNTAGLTNAPFDYTASLAL